jgi:hypothetical protein
LHINWNLREIDIKIVYYGPPLSGKTTNLQQIHQRMAGKQKSELVSLKADGDRTLFFDFLPLEVGQIGGLKPRFNLYTVPGQSIYRATRRLILEDVDGLAFVADSQRSRMADNERSLRELKRYLQSYGYRWYDIPIVLQYNKRDLANRAPKSVLQRRLNPDGALPHFTSIAIEGKGVTETLKTMINMVLAHAQDQLLKTSNSSSS